MRTRILSALILCCSILLFSCSDQMVEDNISPGSIKSSNLAVATGVTVQWNQEYQNIDGFGVSQGYTENIYCHRKRTEIMNWLFGDDGLKLNILRGQLSTFYSPGRDVYDFGFDRDIDIPFDDPLFGYITEGGTPNFIELSKRANLWVYREAKQVHNIDKLIFSVWSPPYYMKSNNSEVQGSLKRSEFQNYADYLAHFIKEFRSNGYPIYALSPANEPEYAASWTSCLWMPGSLTLGPFITNNFGPTLQREGLDTKIIFGENGQWSGILGFILGSASYTANIINLNPRITNYSVIAAGHGYLDPISGKRPEIIPFDKAMQKDIPVWLTEVSSIDYDNIRWDIEDGVKWAGDWHRYLSDASASAIIYWLGAVPGENDEGLIYTDTNDRTSYRLTKRFETFGNFSRYIEVDSRRIHIDRGTGLPSNLHVSSYKKGNKMVVVVVNESEEYVQTPLSVNGVNITGLKRSLTDADNRWAETDVNPDNGQYILDIPGKSVATFITTVE